MSVTLLSQRELLILRAQRHLLRFWRWCQKNKRNSFSTYRQLFLFPAVFTGLSSSLFDAAVPYQISFQSEATPSMLNLVAFHNDLSLVLAVVFGFTLVILLRMIYLFAITGTNGMTATGSVGSVAVCAEPFRHHTNLEIVWTSIPIFVLLLVAGPSLSLLYSSDELIRPQLTIKILGHQWYWTYETSDFTRIVTTDNVVTAEAPVNPGELFFSAITSSKLVLEEEEPVFWWFPTSGENSSDDISYFTKSSSELNADLFASEVESDLDHDIVQVSLIPGLFESEEEKLTTWNLWSIIPEKSDLTGEKEQSVEDSSLTMTPDYVFDSYMVPESDLIEGQLRLLETTQRLYLPIDTQIRFLVTSMDVLHSWAVPSLGIKIDACPGRLNQIGTKIFRPGLFYGQCSEICGINHAFMPIQVEGVGIEWYKAFCRFPNSL